MRCCIERQLYKKDHYFDNVTFDCKHSPLVAKPSVIASGAKQSPAFNVQATVEIVEPVPNEGRNLVPRNDTEM